VSPTCRWCGQPIKWVVTERGRNMCLDPEPNPAGNVVLLAQPDGGQRARVLKAAQLAEWRGTRLWMPHPATCTHVRTRTGTTGQI
jgi:hypothetical protein